MIMTLQANTLEQGHTNRQASSLGAVLVQIATGDVNGVKTSFLRISEEDPTRHQCVVLAAAHGQVAILEYLASVGVNIHFNSEETLRVAAENGRTEVIRFLHQAGADLKQCESELVTAAAFYGHTEALRYLQENGCDLSPCAGLLERLLSRPALFETLRFLTERGITPLGLNTAALAAAIDTGDVSLVGAKLTYIDLAAIGGALLERAAKNGTVEVIKLLHSSGADISNNTSNVLNAAAKAGNDGAIRYIAENAHLSAVDKGAAIAIAAEHGHIKVVDYLWHKLASQLEQITSDTLQLIAFNGYDEIFDFLTDAGLDGIGKDRVGIEAMLWEIRSAPPIFQPSKLWEFFNDINLEQLRRFGVHRFKRCVNQNYFNHVPLGLSDSPLRGLARFFVRHPTWTVIRTCLNDPDRYSRTGEEMAPDRRIFQLWADRTHLASLGRGFQRQLYRMLVGVLWRQMEHKDALGLRRGLSEPSLGAPIETWLKDRSISQDLAHSVIECNAMLAGLEESPNGRPLLVAEVGPGYGRVGDVLLSSCRSRYFVFDIPPSLYLAQWYLSRRHSTKRVFNFRHFDCFEDVREELEAADIAFFTANQIALFPDGYFDLVVNISSLHEMRPEQMHHVLEEMYRISSQRIYLKQYRYYSNPWDKIEVPESDYFVPKGWSKLSWSTDAIDSQFFEAVLVKERVDSINPVTTTAAPRHAAVVERRPSVAILLANYNEAPFLRTSLEAIFAQTDPADEIIFIDDGSTDGSVELIEQFLVRHPQARLIRHSSNRGQHLAIQRALLAATSDYIVWAASDDLLLPQFIERNRAILAKHHGVGICFSRLCTFQDGGQKVVEYTEKNHGAAFDLGDSPRKFLPSELQDILRRHYLWISGNTVLARRDALIEMGGFAEELRWHADWFTFYGVALRYGACGIPETLAMMRVREHTYSSSGMQNRRDQVRVLRTILDTIKRPCNLDLVSKFREGPSLLSPFGRAMVLANALRINHWDIVLPLFFWQAKRYLPIVWARLRARISIFW